MNQKEVEFFEEQGIIVKQEIGKGGFGQIFLVYSTVYKSLFALKRIPMKRFNQAEIDVLKSINYINIVNLYQYYKFENNVYLLMEYCQNDLYHLIINSEETDCQCLYKYCSEIVKSIKALHDCNIAHNDIKPSNFLVDKYGRIKACDFGLSMMNDDYTHNCKGTLFFMAPELLQNENHNPLKSDIWALGVTLFFLSTRTYPFIASNSQLMLKMIMDGNYPIFAVKNPNLRRVIMRCLQINPDDRCTINEILEMPYFANGLQAKTIRTVFSQGQCSILIKPKFTSEKSVLVGKHSFIPSKLLIPRPIINTKR